MKLLAMLAGGCALAAALVAQDAPAVFRGNARMVEVYATVLDRKGHYVDGIPRERFQVSDNGQPQPIVAFENNDTGLACAILLDTTGSMRDSLPMVKNSIGRLIDEFRDEDWVAVYGFSTSLDLLQDFTRNRAAARRAVMRTRASGMTALFDAMTHVTIDIGARSGKKAVVVFTDGDDNSSVLNAGRVVERAKKMGTPLYTVAQGEARASDALMDRLREIARLTGGKAYGVRGAHEAAQIFEDISAELRHTYLLAYQPPEAKDDEWRRITANYSAN